MSSGNIKAHFFVGALEAGTPQLDSNIINNNFLSQIEASEHESITILNQSYQKAVEIHQILSNNKELSNNQKLDFCSLARHFMKQYLKDVIKKLK